jgi:hypothetical protein
MVTHLVSIEVRNHYAPGADGQFLFVKRIYLPPLLLIAAQRQDLETEDKRVSGFSCHSGKPGAKLILGPDLWGRSTLVPLKERG